MKKGFETIIAGLSTIGLAFGTSYLISLFMDINIPQFAKDMLLFSLVFEIIDVYKVKVIIKKEIEKIKF